MIQVNEILDILKLHVVSLLQLYLCIFLNRIQIRNLISKHRVQKLLNIMYYSILKLSMGGRKLVCSITILRSCCLQMEIIRGKKKKTFTSELLYSFSSQYRMLLQLNHCWKSLTLKILMSRSETTGKLFFSDPLCARPWFIKLPNEAEAPGDVISDKPKVRTHFPRTSGSRLLDKITEP